MRQRFGLIGLCLLIVTGLAPAAETDPILNRMKKDVFFLAGEECEGRGIETQGILKAGEYIADTFKKAGLKPGGVDGTYFQPFTINGAPRLGTPNSLTLTGPEGAKELKYGTEFTPTAMSSMGKKKAELVFVGYGITADKLKYDDYAGVNVEGKYVIVMRRTPRADGKPMPFDPNPASPFQALNTKIANAVAHKAAGIIIVNDATLAKEGMEPDELVPFSYRSGGAADIPVLMIKRAVLDQLLSAQKKKLADIEKAIDTDLKPQSMALTGWSAESEVTITRPKLPARNVIAISEGSGPLANETIVIGAHYDHLGRGEGGRGASLDPKPDGKIHYGADDNASGTTGVMELARRFGAMPNRVGRRIVFMTFSGEERGLLGSVHYTQNPLIPLDKIVFMLNMDMIGRVAAVDDDSGLLRTSALAGGAIGSQSKGAVVKRDRLEISGTGTAVGFDELVTAANRPFDFKLLRLPGGTGPSDHQSFFLQSIPVLFMFTGLHSDYHRPTDTPDKINVDGMKKVADFAELLVVSLAASAERPKYIKNTTGWRDLTNTQPQQDRSSGRSRGVTLGIMPGNYGAESGGVLVSGVSPGGAAEKAGIKAEDVIVEIAGKPVKNIEGYMGVMAGQRAGQAIEVVIVRKEKKITIKVIPQ